MVSLRKSTLAWVRYLSPYSTCKWGPLSMTVASVIWRQVQNYGLLSRLKSTRSPFWEEGLLSPQGTSHQWPFKVNMGFWFLVKVRSLNNSPLFSITNSFPLLQKLPASSVQGDLESGATVLPYHVVPVGSGHCCQEVLQDQMFIVLPQTATGLKTLATAWGSCVLSLPPRKPLC